MDDKRVRLDTGVELHYAESGPEGPAEVVLLLHGWPDSGFSFHRVMEAPKMARVRALAPDQRGFGDSERPESGYAIEDLAADAAAFLDALGLAGVTVTGHSMGSFVARRLALRRPDLVRRLVLIGTAPSADNDVVRGLAAQVADLADPVPEEFVRAFQSGTTATALPEDFVEGIVAESRKAPARVWQHVLDGLLAADDTAELGSISARTLVIGGAEDPLFSTDDQEALADAIPGTRFTLYPGVGHCPNWERPERVAADIAAFLRAT